MRAPAPSAGSARRLAPMERRPNIGGRRPRRTAHCGQIEATRRPEVSHATAECASRADLRRPVRPRPSLAYPSGNAGDYGASVTIAVVSFVVAAILANSVKVANQWERVVVLRLGRFDRLAGPGLFFIIPILDMVAYRIDIRVITSTFKAEKTMTRDTVPVDVDAVLFWKVIDPKRPRSTSPITFRRSIGRRRRRCAT